jgi:hypothetical protein
MRLKLIDTFLPPGVQAKIYQRLGHCPRQLPVRQSNQISRLWLDVKDMALLEAGAD